jgi:hypothetical protein
MNYYHCNDMIELRACVDEFFRFLTKKPIYDPPFTCIYLMLAYKRMSFAKKIYVFLKTIDFGSRKR